jgi:uncharacterized delta-60 repeat protein
VAGSSDQGSTELDFALARYDSDGSLDTTFDADGLLTTDFNNKIDFIASIAIQSDGKIVVAGDTYYPGFLDRRDIAIARYLSDGALDTSFGSGGKHEIDLTPGISPHFAEEGQSIALGTDGRIVVAGFSMIGGNYKSDLFLEFLYNPCVLLLLEGDSDQTPELDVDNDNVLDLDDNCQFVANPDQSDFDGDGLGDVCDADPDGDDIDDDGVPNDIDECDFTPLGEVIEPSTGCAIEELVPCEGPRGTTEDWKNHGKYVSTLAKTLNSFVEEGLITEEEKDAIMSEGASSDCGNK